MSFPEETSFIDLSAQQQEQKLNAHLEKHFRETLDAGHPIYYRDSHCRKESEYVREFKDGRRDLGRFDDNTKEFVVIQTLNA